MRRAALALAVALLAGCGGGDEQTAPAEWCNTTGEILYLLDQHSTTLTQTEVGDWMESAPEDIASSVSDAGGVLRRYPVDAHAPALVDARKEIEAYSDDACPEGWRDAFERPPR